MVFVKLVYRIILHTKYIFVYVHANPSHITSHKHTTTVYCQYMISV